MRPRLVLTVAAAIAATSACSTAELPTAGPVAVYEPSGEGGDSALLEGSLTNRDGCVVVESAEPATFSVPVLPGEASWSDGKLSFEGRTYPDGTNVSLGGGYSTGTAATTSDDRYVPDACAGLDVFVVHQDTTSLTGDE